MEQKTLGRYIVADPKICHGKPTFKGTRILVKDVLKMVAEGLSWEFIIEQWHGNISKAAITEAVQLSMEQFLQNETLIAKVAA